MDDDQKEGWEQLTDIFKDFQTKSLGYWYMHNNASKRTNCMRLSLAVPAMILSSASGVTLFASMKTENGDGCEEDPISLTVVIGVFEILSIIISAVQTIFNFGESVGRHKAAAEAYHTIALTIDQQLNLPVSKRDNPMDFYATVNAQYNELSKHNSDIHECDIREFQSYLKKNPTSTNPFGIKFEASRE